MIVSNVHFVALLDSRPTTAVEKLVNDGDYVQSYAQCHPSEKNSTFTDILVAKSCFWYGLFCCLN